MIMRYEYLSQHATVFQKCTGLSVDRFDQLVEEVLPLYREAEARRLNHPQRPRAVGAGHPFELELRHHLLLTVIWLRLYPLHEVLGYLFGVSDATVSRLIERVLPLLEASGRDGMRLPDPGKKRRRQLPELLKDIPELTVIVDSFEQRVQRPPHDESHYSGKKSSIHSKVSLWWTVTPGGLSRCRRVYPAPPLTSSCWNKAGCWNGCQRKSDWVAIWPI